MIAINNPKIVSAVAALSLASGGLGFFPTRAQAEDLPPSQPKTEFVEKVEIPAKAESFAVVEIPRSIVTEIMQSRSELEELRNDLLNLTKGKTINFYEQAYIRNQAQLDALEELAKTFENLPQAHQSFLREVLVRENTDFKDVHNNYFKALTHIVGAQNKATERSADYKAAGYSENDQLRVSSYSEEVARIEKDLLNADLSPANAIYRINELEVPISSKAYERNMEFFSIALKGVGITVAGILAMGVVVKPIKDKIEMANNRKAATNNRKNKLNDGILEPLNTLQRQQAAIYLETRAIRNTAPEKIVDDIARDAHTAQVLLDLVSSKLGSQKKIAEYVKENKSADPELNILEDTVGIISRKEVSPKMLATDVIKLIGDLQKRNLDRFKTIELV